MKLMLIVVLMCGGYSKGQTLTTKQLSDKMRAAETSISTLKTSVAKLVIDTVAKAKRIVTLEKNIKIFQDSLEMYKAYPSSDFYIDKNKNISIPKLLLIEARVTKLEAKP